MVKYFKRKRFDEDADCSRRYLHVGSAIAVIVVIVTAEACIIAVARHPRCRALVIGQEVQDPAPLWMRKYDLLYISP